MDYPSIIKEKLKEIEQAENVRVIMAVESGSRAWGFSSEDSDYDVRFIYVRTNEDYLRLERVRDVIEWQLDEVYDISGWDLKKALVLLHDSNPTLHEWCESPIVYMEHELAKPFRALTREHFLPKKALYHYVNMTEHNYRTYLSGEEVRLKKYFYALRPILAAKWVAERKTPPPSLLEDLVDAELPAELLPDVQRLLEMKRNASEFGVGPQILSLNEYILEQLEEMRQAAAQEENRKNSWDALDAFFLEAVLG